MGIWTPQPSGAVDPTTAVALAASLKADQCKYTQMLQAFTIDPMSARLANLMKSAMRNAEMTTGANVSWAVELSQIYKILS